MKSEEIVEELSGTHDRYDKWVRDVYGDIGDAPPGYHDLSVAINQAADHIEALEAEIERWDWQPIETVPQDGTPVLVWLPDPMQKSHVHAATFAPNVSVIGNLFAFDATCEPTHWMPLPDTPDDPE